MIHIPRRIALFLTGISGLFGMRTPPEPEVIAQMSPAKGPEGRRPDPSEEKPGEVHVVLSRPGRRDED
jgi:hypothetical protein